MNICNIFSSQMFHNSVLMSSSINLKLCGNDIVGSRLI